MFIINLCPLPIRAAPQWLAWLAIPALSRIPLADVVLLGAPWQVGDIDAIAHGDWVRNSFGRLPAGAHAAAGRLTVPAALVRRISDSFPTTLDLERAMIEEGFQEYREFLFTALSPLAEAGQITAIVTVGADRSLEDVARYLNLRIMRIEPSPIRGPAYRYESFALDFSGETGFSEAERRFDRCVAAADASLEELQAELLHEPPAPPQERHFEVGVALQDDSNGPPDGFGWTMPRLLYKARQVFPPDAVLLRQHPNAWLRLGGAHPFGSIDTSDHSVRFVAHCKRLLTISSCVAFDALLLGVPAYVLGASYLRFACHAQFDRHVWEGLHVRPDQLSRVAFLAEHFYVPETLLLDPWYMRFRLGDPDEAQIGEVHREARREAIAVAAARRARG